MICYYGATPNRINYITSFPYTIVLVYRKKNILVHFTLTDRIVCPSGLAQFNQNKAIRG